ncbi:amino acid ABC transporter substrate-binding protein [Virgibacillus salinus]|uniref:Amino acid ABC transporter substrate-binding protein, PAAT family /L-cystine-binding protein n=1 Tax=Virgibacillus salinus TaxID=553311 RepID=A0A1H0YRA6_9BACI|nr:amino acid ABC transporter substrate-binding protein [Virgibacillus salinus]SDQ17618.1 amino acid ABC transporter substrate-binding protein, PAAT family /L-cystine-binding protein [Virgibacillus salinus]
MKKLFYLLVLASLVAVISACGSGEEQQNNSADNESGEKTASLYDQVMEKGVLTVGTEGTYAPFTFHNAEDKLTGYDVEVIREVANRMDVDVEFMETKWDSMFAGLNSKRFDLIANQVGINEERKANYDFSVPYTYSSAVVVTPKDNESIDSFDDLKGKKSAQSLTSNFEEIAKENGAEIVSIKGLAQSIELLKQSRADVTVNDRLAVLDYIQQQGSEQIKIAAKQDDASKTAFAFNKGNEELVNAVDKQLKAMKEDGTLAKIAKEWFGEDVSSK